MSRRGGSRAFTLVEVLLSIAILMLLMGLLMPVLASAREAGKTTVCTSNMRQIGMAISMYRSDFDNGYPRTPNLDHLVTGRYITDRSLLMCPSDPFVKAGMWTVDRRCRGSAPKGNQSYYTSFDKQSLLLAVLSKSDDNPGLVACRSHGERTKSFSTQAADVCQKLPFMFDKSVLRLRSDGSVQRAKFSLEPDPAVQNSVETFRFYRLFTDTEIKPRPSPVKKT